MDEDHDDITELSDVFLLFSGTSYQVFINSLSKDTEYVLDTTTIHHKNNDVLLLWERVMFSTEMSNIIFNITTLLPNEEYLYIQLEDNNPFPSYYGKHIMNSFNLYMEDKKVHYNL